MPSLLRCQINHLFAAYTKNLLPFRLHSCQLRKFGLSQGQWFVTSFDGCTTYLLIVCASIWDLFFLHQRSKTPPYYILATFPKIHGLSSGYHSLRMDQGGKQSIKRKIDMKPGYHIDPSGLDAASKIRSNSLTTTICNVQLEICLWMLHCP